MRDRLLLGPLLIAALVGGFALDQWLDGCRSPWTWLAGPDGTLPPGIVLFGVMFATSVLAARELSTILEDKGIEASKRMMTLAAGLGLVVSCLIPDRLGAVDAAAVVSGAAVATLGGSLLFYSRHRTVKGVVASVGGTLLAFVYLGLTFGFLLAVRREHSAWAVVWIIIVTKSCDIGAYFTGVTLGRHKLIPWLSPGKTWEGLVGGVVTAALVAWAGMALLTRELGLPAPAPWVPISAGVLFALVGQAGDLVASLFKRDAGIKDSGRVLPGFGGVLDLIDSPLMVAPAAYLWVRAVETWGALGRV